MMTDEDFWRVLVDIHGGELEALLAMHEFLHGPGSGQPTGILAAIESAALPRPPRIRTKGRRAKALAKAKRRR